MKKIFFIGIYLCLFLSLTSIICAQEIRKPEVWGVYYNGQTDTFIILFDPQISGNQCLRKQESEKTEVGYYVGLGYWSDSVIMKFGEDIYKFNTLTNCLILQAEKDSLLFNKEKITIKEFLREKL